MELESLLDRALADDGGPLRTHLTDNSGLPGARLNLRLVDDFATLVGDVVTRPNLRLSPLAALLDGWAALDEAAAPGDKPEVILPCAALAAYGAVGVTRPEWWSDEIAKLRTGARDPRWRVREVVARALQRLLDADWSRTVEALRDWAGDDDPLVVRASVAAVAEPPLLRAPDRAADALALQRLAVDRFRRYPAERRGDEDVRVLRKALGFTISVAAAATGDVTLLAELEEGGDADLRWIARENAKKARLRPFLD